MADKEDDQTSDSVEEAPLKFPEKGLDQESEGQEEEPESEPIDQRQKQKPHDRHSIMEIRVFVDDGAREVREFSQVFGKSKMASFYKGRAVIQVREAGPGGTEMPPRMQPFEFDIEATGLKNAFELFDETAESELQEMRDNQASRQKERPAVVPVGGAGKALIGLDGKPLGG